MLPPTFVLCDDLQSWRWNDRCYLLLLLLWCRRMVLSCMLMLLLWLLLLLLLLLLERWSWRHDAISAGLTWRSIWWSGRSLQSSINYKIEKFKFNSFLGAIDKNNLNSHYLNCRIILKRVDNRISKTRTIHDWVCTTQRWTRHRVCVATLVLSLGLHNMTWRCRETDDTTRNT